MSRLAERYTVLLEAGAGYLDRMHYIYQLSTNPKVRPAFFVDRKMAETIKEMSRKFPELPPDADRIAGLDLVIAKAKQELEKLETAFQLFLDVYEWKDEAMNTLEHTASHSPNLKFEETPHLVAAFLNLMVMVGQLVMTMSEIPDRKNFVVLYGRIFYNMKGQQDGNFAKVAHFVHDYEAPVRRLSEEMKAISPRVGQILCSTCFEFLRTRDVTILRKDGTLSLTTNPAQMSLPSQEPFMYLLALSPNLYMWMLYGFLFCPEELILSEALAIVKSTLSSGYVSALSRDVSFYFQDEYDNTFDKHKNKTFKATLKKEKKAISDAVAAAVTNRHKDRRVFIRQELSNLYNILRDQPGLVGPKIQLVLTALSVSREEIFWYFRHLDSPPPKSSGQKQNKAEFMDSKIPELLYLHEALVAFIRANARTIQQYYVTYLLTSDFIKAQELAGELTTKAPACANFIKMILNDMSFATANSDFRALRLNWFRAEVSISTAGVALSPLVNALKKFALLSRHSKYIDGLEDLVQEHSSLKQLWYWKESLFQTFDACIQSPQQPAYALAFLRLLGQFSENATIYTPEERDLIGSECVQIARACLEKISHRVATLASDVARVYIAFEAQLATENAVYPWLVRLKDYKLDKAFPSPPIPPGLESGFKERHTVEGVRLAENNIHQLLTALNEYTSIIVFDHTFTPREFVRDSLSSAMRDFMQKVAVNPNPTPTSSSEGLSESEILRPSVVERYIVAYCSYIKSFENYIELNMGEMIREVWIGSVYHKTLSGQLMDWTTDGSLDVGSSVIRPFSAWYAEFVAKRIVITKEKEIFFSPNRKGFYSRAGMPFKAERLADIVEFKALCNIVGPYGVKLIDREILRFIHANVAGLKEGIVNNRAVLDELMKSYHKEQQFNEAAKKIRSQDVDVFLSRNIAIGNALHFRQLLHESLRITTEDRIPYIFSAVAAAYNQYPRNTFSSTDCLAVDCLAKDLGIEVQSADHALKTYIQRAMGGGDSAIWNFLPVMYAVSFVTSRVWTDAEFRPMLESYSTNAHVLALTIAELITAAKSVSSSGVPDTKDITNALQSFIEITATVLLRLVRAKPGEKKNLSSLIIFLDKFVDSTSFVTRDFLESVLPYCFLRTMYSELYETAQTKGAREQVGEEH